MIQLAASTAGRDAGLTIVLRRCCNLIEIYHIIIDLRLLQTDNYEKYWTVSAPGTNVAREERTVASDNAGSLPNNHHHHHHHHYHQQQQHLRPDSSKLQANALAQVHSLNSQRFQGIENSVGLIHQRAAATAATGKDASAPFEKAATSGRTMNTANGPISSHVSLHKRFETSNGRGAAGIHPPSAFTPVVLAKNRQHDKVLAAHHHPASNAPAASAEVRRQPAIAVIQLSSRSADDKVVYHERMAPNRHHELDR